MRIGIFTFHNAHNYGAVLQAYALRTKLRELGYDASIINYRNVYVERGYQMPIPQSGEKMSLRHPRAWKRILGERMDVYYAQKDWAERCRVFRRFISEVLLEGEDCMISADELPLLGLDAMICGSDQIWTDWLTGGKDPVYYGDVTGIPIKITYAASRFDMQFSEGDALFIKHMLHNFRAVSVREENLAKVLNGLIGGTDIAAVLDPTLLLKQEKYELLEMEIPEREPYVLAYYLTEDPVLMQCAERMAELLQINLIEIHYKKQRKKRVGRQIADCGPGEFLSYIHHASFVITNSFHGLAFSLIYQKEFYCVYGADERKQDLLDMLLLQDRHIRESSEIDLNCEINYSTVQERLQEEREKSVRFLQKGLEP